MNDTLTEERTGKRVVIENPDSWIAKNWKWIGSVIVMFCASYFSTQGITNGLVGDLDKLNTRVIRVEQKVEAQEVLTIKIDNLKSTLDDFKQELSEYRKERMDDLRRNQRK